MSEGCGTSSRVLRMAARTRLKLAHAVARRIMHSARRTQAASRVARITGTRLTAAARLTARARLAGADHLLPAFSRSTLSLFGCTQYACMRRAILLRAINITRENTLHLPALQAPSAAGVCSRRSYLSAKRRLKRYLYRSISASCGICIDTGGMHRTFCLAGETLSCPLYIA